MRWSRYLAIQAAAAVACFSLAWIWIAAAPMAYLDPDYPVWRAKLDMLRHCDLGDVLIVAVNSDDSVKRLKGETRPLNACEDRMRMLASLKSVDWVVPFAEDTPARLIGRVLPKLLVKGGDYKPEQVAGHDDVTRNGGQVVILDFYDGYSTTRIIERARSK